MKRILLSFVVLAVLLLCCANPARSQSTGSNSGTVRGSVVDPSGAAVKGASVEIQNPVSHYAQTATTDDQGRFELVNVPFNNYHLSVTVSGFQNAAQDIDVRSTVPLALAALSLKLGAQTTEVTVAAAQDLLETDPTTHTDVDRELFDKLPLESQSSGLSSLVTLATPGIAADSNGLFHGLGDHASNSFSIDGQPITDQQSKVFSNQLPVDAVQSLEVIEGAPPAEFGGKTSVVIVATTRSGMGASVPHGDVTASFGSFGTSTGSADLSYGGKSWGNFISLSGMDTSRFLDGPELTVMHDHGNMQNAFDRVDFKLGAANTINLNFGFTRSWFQTPNSFDAQNATAWSGPVCENYLSYSTTCNGLGPNGQVVGSQDQVSKIRTFNIAPTFTRLMNAHTVFTLSGFARQDQYNYYPSANPFADLTPDLQLQSVGQNRRLTNLGTQATLSYVKGIHNIKMGVKYSDTIITEIDSIGIVDPTANAVCLNPDGSPALDTTLTNPSGCTGDFQANPNFNPLLACYDLTRTAPLPASDGCPNATSGRYTFNGHADIRETALYLQDTITKANWTFNLGIRADFYHGITTATQGEPRLGIAYRIKPTNTVLRVSYARTMESPFNENLVLASLGCLDPVINALQAPVPGGTCVSTTPLSPGHRNGVFTPVSSRLSGKYLVIDGEYIWKYTQPRLSILAYWATRRSPILSSGWLPRFPVTRSAPASRISTAFPPSSLCPAWRHGFSDPRLAESARRPGPFPYSASTTTRNSTRRFTCNTSLLKKRLGSASTGATTAVWLPVRHRAPAETAPTDRMGAIASWTSPGSPRINSSRRDSTAGARMRPPPRLSVRRNCAPHRNTVRNICPCRLLARRTTTITHRASHPAISSM